MNRSQSPPTHELEGEAATFDIFVQSVDLRWCLLLHCDFASLAAVRQLASPFTADVPLVLSSEHWCASASNRTALHAAQWAAGGDTLHVALSQPLGQTVVSLRCSTAGERELALAGGAEVDEEGEAGGDDLVMVVLHPIGHESRLTAAQLGDMAPSLAQFLHEPLTRTTTEVEGPTHNQAVKSVSAAPDAIVRADRPDAPPPPARGLRARRSRHLVASGGLDGISRVSGVTPRGNTLEAAPLSVALRHGSHLTAAEVRPSGALLTACEHSSTLRVYELEPVHLAAERIAAAGMEPPHPSTHEWNYVERARLSHTDAPPSVAAAAWLDDGTLVEAGYAEQPEQAGAAAAAAGGGAPPCRVLRTWRLSSDHSSSTPPPAVSVARYYDGRGEARLDDGAGDVSALAAADGLVVVTHNPLDLTRPPPHLGSGFTDVWRAVPSQSGDASAPPELAPRWLPVRPWGCAGGLTAHRRRPGRRRSAGCASTPRRCTRVRSGARGDDRCPRRPPSRRPPSRSQTPRLAVLRRADCHRRRRQHRAAVAGGHRGGAGVLAGADGRRRGARPHRAAEVLRRL
uniref:Uncharacterized protein n=1 Tax=Emiliania huxleyi TaxID=2903 RepID=A0A6V2QSH1_EMIHU